MNATSLVQHSQAGMNIAHVPAHKPPAPHAPAHVAPPHTSVIAGGDTWRPYGPAAKSPVPAPEQTEPPVRERALEGAVSPDPSRPAEKALGHITKLLEESVEGMSPAETRERMAEKYRTLRLMDEQGQWTVPALARYSDVLLPSDLDASKMKAFVEDMAGAARENPYLMKFLDRAAAEEFPKLREQVAEEGRKAFPDILLHAQVLERLTTVLADDYQNSKACREHWKQFESDPAFWSDMNVFQKAKLVSVNMGIDKYNEIHETGRVDPNTLEFVLPLNIMEAVTVDAYQGTFGPEGRGAREGHRGNAYAGWILATHGPHADGPSTFSPDGKMVELRQKEVKAWDDLYQTWNMDFVTIAQDWPTLITKLTIPQVAGYKDRPAEYINKRALALHLTMTWIALRDREAARKGVDWTDPHLSDLWGKVNAESAREYEALSGQGANGTKA